MAKKCIDHLGNEFPTEYAMCGYHGVKQSTYRNRLSRGLTKEEALRNDSTEVLDYNGRAFSSVRAMCRFHGVSASHYYRSLQEGGSLEEALTPSKKPIWSDHIGNVYDTCKDMCEHYGITVSTYNARKVLDWDLKDILTIPPKGKHEKKPSIKKAHTDHNGNVFYSQAEMCRSHGVTSGAFKGRKKKGLSLEECLQPVEEVDHLGNRYKTEKEMCNAYRINIGTFRMRRSLGWSLEEALTTPTNCKRKNQKSVKYEGKTYNSIAALSKETSVPVYHISRHLGEGKTVEEAIEAYHRYQNRKDGRYVNPKTGKKEPLKKIAKSNGIKYTTLLRRLNNGMELEEALDKEVIKRGECVVDHKGIVYKDLNTKCAAYGIKRATYRSRIKAGKTEEEALTGKVIDTKPLQTGYRFITNSGFAATVTASGGKTADIVFDDGSEKKNVSSQMIRRGNVSHPAFKSQARKGLICGIKVKYVTFQGEEALYTMECPKCGYRDIVKTPEIISHAKKCGLFTSVAGQEAYYS